MLLQLPLVPEDAGRLLEWLVKAGLVVASGPGAVSNLRTAAQLLGLAARKSPLSSHANRALLDVASRYCTNAPPAAATMCV